MATRLTPDELAQAAAILARHLEHCGTHFSISGGAAASLLRFKYQVSSRATDDIDLVVQPKGNIDAESVSKWLCDTYPEVFGTKEIYGVPIPVIKFTRDDGSRIDIEIEMFDVRAWPTRPQYDLSSPDNECITVPVDGIMVPIFGPRWILREKIVTAYERQGSRKEATDLVDISQLLLLRDLDPVDLSHYPEAVSYVLSKRPGFLPLMKQKVHCPSVLDN